MVEGELLMIAAMTLFMLMASSTPCIALPLQSY
jgi:hypothetical protein